MLLPKVANITIMTKGHVSCVQICDRLNLHLFKFMHKVDEFCQRWEFIQEIKILKVVFFLVNTMVKILVSYFFLGRKIVLFFFSNLPFYLVESVFPSFVLESCFSSWSEACFFFFLKIFLSQIPASEDFE